MTTPALPPLRLFECRVIVTGGRVARTFRVLARDSIAACHACGPVAPDTEHSVTEVIVR